MSLRPIRKARHRQQARYRSFNRQQQWKPWQGWTWKRNKGFNKFFTTRRFKISILLFLAVIGIFSIDQALKGTIGNSLVCHIFPSWASPECLDPIQTIWNATASDGFNLYAGNKTITTVTNCFDFAANSASCLTMHSFQANSTLVALSKATVGDLSVASKYTLGIVQSIAFDTLITTNARWGYYLTTNGTIPHHAIGSTSAYRPEFDPSVILSGEFFCNVSCGTTSPSIYQTVKLLRTIGQTDTIESERTLTCGEGSQFLCRAQVIPSDFSVCPNSSFSGCLSSATYLNFTGIVNGQTCTITNPTGIGPAPGCSWIENSPYATVDSTKWGSSQTLPWMQVQAVQYYIGFYASAGSGNIGFAFDNGPHSTSPAFAGMKIFLYTPQPNGPTLDTSGFFGPVIKALINLGVFILNGILQFIAFLTPALQSALGVLEGFMASVLNFIGGLLGYPTLGTDLIGFVNALVTFFTNGAYGLPAAFANFPTLFSDFLKWLQVVFPIITPAFTIANGVLTFAVNGISIAVTILTVGTQLILFGYAFILIFSYFMFTGDDAVGGLFTYLGTAQAIAFKIINLLAVFVNYGLDFLTNVIGLIPKPLVQMGAAKFPRLPTIDSGASITMPAMDLGEFRNGNLLSVWLWTLGFYFDTWYESRNPALPGSIGALIPSLATNMQTLASLLPLFQTFVLIAGGTTLFWLVMRPLHILGADLGIFESVGIGAGRRGGAGPSRFGFVAGTKHLRGGLRRTAGLEESTGGGFGSRLGKRFRGSKASTGPTPEEQSTA